MQILNGIDVNPDWTGFIAIAKNGGTWKTLRSIGLSVYPQLTTDRNKNLKYKVSILDVKDEIEWFFLDEVENQPTWTNDASGIVTAVNDITTWIGSSDLSNLDVPLSTRASEATLQLLLSEVEMKNKLLKVDKVGNITYLGYADAGSIVSDPVWAIKRWTEAGSDADAEWADGNKNFDNIWDNRLILTYT